MMKVGCLPTLIALSAGLEEVAVKAAWLFCDEINIKITRINKLDFIIGHNTD